MKRSKVVGAASPRPPGSPAPVRRRAPFSPEQRAEAAYSLWLAPWVRGAVRELEAQAEVAAGSLTLHAGFFDLDPPDLGTELVVRTDPRGIERRYVVAGHRVWTDPRDGSSMVVLVECNLLLEPRA